MTNTESPAVPLLFANGTWRPVAAQLAPRVVGLDADGDLLVPLMEEMPDYLIPLTPCCNASGKGGAAGVICRACYRNVSYKYGGQEELAVAVVR